MENANEHIDGFMESVSAFQKEIERLAVDSCGWAIANPQNLVFLNKIRKRPFRQNLYHEFDIPKKSGGVRHITAPAGMLKDVQRCISTLLSQLYRPSEAVHGFTLGRSVLTNANCHLGRNYVLNIDLKDFFPSVTLSMIIGSLMQLGFSKEVSRYIAVVCTKSIIGEEKTLDVLVQGSPASPVLANIACTHMDYALSSLAERFNLIYSRYADDMTFSSDHSVYARGSEFLSELEQVVENHGFTMNGKKTRLLRKGARQEVTGLTVGEKANVSRRYLKNLRAQIFGMEMRGFTDKTYHQAQGKLAYLAMVRGKYDPCTEKLRARLERIRWYPMGIANYR